MAKNSIRDYSATNSSNTDIQSIDISEGCSPAGINNAIREVMADLKDVSTGAVALESPSADSLTVTGAFTSQGIDDNATSTAMTLDSSGNVGIGTGTVAANTKLHVKAGTNLNFEVENASSTLRLSALNDARSANIPMQFASSQFEFISGNVGIGTSSPQSIVHIDQGASDDAQLTLETHSAGDSKMVFSQGQTAGNWAVGYDDGGGVTENSLSFAYKSDGYPSLSGQNKMLLTPAGNLGIGHTTPQFGLTMAQGNGDSARIGWEDGSNNKRASIICASSSDALQFHTGTSDTERMRITSGGSLLVGSTAHEWSGSMAAQIDGIKGLAVFSSGASSEVIACWNRGDSGTRYQMWFADSTSQGLRGSITTNGSSTSYNTTSDYRLKENVTATWDATTRLKQLNPVRFNFIADADTTVDGFLAHEVQDIVPEAISGTKDAMMDEEYEVTPAVEATYDDEGNVLTEAIPAVMGTRSVPDFQGIDQSKLVPLLVKTIQELEARITALEAN
jgi:hypothetical protein